MIKLYFDLDGVLRDLEKSVFGYRVSHWDQPAKNGMEFFQWVEYQGLQVVDNAGPTKFLKTVLEFYTTGMHKPFKILTHQPESWKPYTEAWINKYLGMAHPEIIYVKSMKDKMAYINDAVLIDDYPGFAGHPNVIIVNKTYNNHTDTKHLRISHVKQMRHVLEYLHSDKASLDTLHDDLGIYIDGEHSSCQTN